MRADKQSGTRFLLPTPSGVNPLVKIPNVKSSLTFEQG